MSDEIRIIRGVEVRFTEAQEEGKRRVEGEWFIGGKRRREAVVFPSDVDAARSAFDSVKAYFDDRVRISKSEEVEA